MRVWVTGGRDYPDRQALWRVLDELHANYIIDVIGHGAYPGGADLYAEQWAKRQQIDYRGYPAKWRAQGGSAGPRRNRHGLGDFQPHRIVACPGGRGTADCLLAAKELGYTDDEIQHVVPA